MFAFYFTFAFQLERTDFIRLVTLFIGLFILCYKLIQFEKWNFKFLLIIGVLSRIIFLPTTPNLSQDFYRFIWDGELVSNFINPYLETPNTIIEHTKLTIANAQELFKGMGALSAANYSNYPPLNQILFGLAALLGGGTIIGNVIALRVIIIFADVGILYFGRKLLKQLNLSPHLIFWYFLNPLVVIELTGNLHFEGVMLFFFIWSFYLLSKNKWQLSAVLLACSISIKLVPLIFLPVFLKFFGFKKSISFYVILLFTSLTLFLPFYTPEFIANYSKTIGLWFSNFEFNASIYNVVKQIAIQFKAKPWELIKIYGKITPYITLLLVLFITFLRQNRDIKSLFSSMLFILTAYYLMSSVVHPWYVIFLVLLGIYTPYRYALVWSALIILSYYAYSQPDFKENLWILAIEYCTLVGFALYEIIALRNKK
jgi:hypothetical protein